MKDSEKKEKIRFIFEQIMKTSKEILSSESNHQKKLEKKILYQYINELDDELSRKDI
ncbi:MAG: hypothetical protein ACQESN_08760 [Thermotogota bacterium]